MHNEAKRLSEWAMCKAKEKGFDCLTSQDWDDFKDCMEAAEKAVKTEYYHHILEEMYADKGYVTTKDMYKEHTAEHYRDIDKHTRGIMYYTEPEMEHEMSDYDKAKRGYEESKMAHKENTPEHKQAKMKDLEMYLKELSEDVTQLIADATPEERAMVKTKMQTLTQKIG